MLSQPLWWHKPMVIFSHHFEVKMAANAGPAALERLVKWKRRSGFNVEHLLMNFTMFEGKGGEDSRAYCFRNFHGYREDWLGRYLTIAHKHGMRVLIYFNCHWFKPDTFPSDYYVVDPAGKPKVIYGDGGEICCFGPFRKWSERMADDLGQYEIDGVFLDGPVKDACWCTHCRAAYQERFGRPLPDNPRSLPPSEQTEYEAFLAEMPVKYIEDFSRGLRKHRPDAVLYCNGGDNQQMKTTLRWTQWIGEEGGFVGYGPINGEFPFGAGLSAKLMEYRAQGRARVIFCDTGYKVYDWYLHPRGEVARMYAGTIANGAHMWTGLKPDAAEIPATQTICRFNRLVHDHSDALTNTESLAEAAIVESPLNKLLAGTVQPTSGDDVHKREASAQRLAVPRHVQEFNGLYAAFARSGYPFDVAGEDVLLEDRLPGRIKLLVLPGVGAMSDSLAECLRRFVFAGGRLLATFDTSLFDGQGVRRGDYALADLFGAHAEGDLIGPSGLDYLAIKTPNALTRGIAQDLLPCPEYWQWVRADSSAKEMLHYYEKMPRRYAALPSVSKHPAVLLSRFGKGQVVFIPSAIGELSLRFRFPDIRFLLRNAAHLLAKPPITVEGGDEFVETTLRRGADGSIAAHLINWAMGERPSLGAIPLGSLTVSVRLPKGTPRPKSVELAMAGRKVRATTSGSLVEFVVPRIDEYEMAIIR